MPAAGSATIASPCQLDRNSLRHPALSVFPFASVLVRWDRAASLAIEVGCDKARRRPTAPTKLVWRPYPKGGRPLVPPQATPSQAGERQVLKVRERHPYRLCPLVDR